MKKWKCTVCGYIHEGSAPPERCPVCSAGREEFVEIVEERETVSQERDSATQQQPEADSGQLAQLVLENHLHPISVHSPNGIVPMAVLFLALALFFGLQSFDSAAYYSLCFTLLTMPPVLMTGYITWKNKYNGVKTSLFITKIAASGVAISVLFILVVWRTINQDILTQASSGRWLFLLLSLILLISVGVAGHLGGQLVFTKKNK